MYLFCRFLEWERPKTHIFQQMIEQFLTLKRALAAKLANFSWGKFRRAQDFHHFVSRKPYLQTARNIHYYYFHHSICMTAKPRNLNEDQSSIVLGAVITRSENQFLCQRGNLNRKNRQMRGGKEVLQSPFYRCGN